MCFLDSKWQYENIGSDSNVAPNRHQARIFFYHGGELIEDAGMNIRFNEYKTPMWHVL